LARKKKLYTLTEVSKRAGVSMPTLQRYKKLYQDRIPSVGEGRRQRYPREAIAEVRKIKAENLKKRGRPRKASPAPAKARAGAKASGLITLSEIGRRTGISYPTLVRYVKLYLDQIPHEGEGRKRRFPEEAVPVFEELRRNSKRGRPKASAGLRKSRTPDAALVQRIRELERAQKEVSRQLASVLALLKRPVQVTIQPR
jgi:DNA-binding transcriptional MerR regulator